MLTELGKELGWSRDPLSGVGGGICRSTLGRAGGAAPTAKPAHQRAEETKNTWPCHRPDPRGVQISKLSPEPSEQWMCAACRLLRKS